MPDLPESILQFGVQIGVAVLKHQAEKHLGEGALEILAETLADIAGTSLNEKLQGFLTDERQLRKVRQVFQRADERFSGLKPAYRDMQVRLSDLDSLERHTLKFPHHLDDPDFLLTVIESRLVEDYPNLSPDFLHQAAQDYRNALEDALAALFQEALLPLLYARLSRLSERVDAIYTFLSRPQPYVATFNAAIRNFLTLYLGKPGAPVPFGGREAELADLQYWLDFEPTPYRLLTAPAGRGKTALLIHWVALLERFRKWQVIFLPISIRAGTNLETVFYRALAARLSEHFNEPLPGRVDHNTPVEVWKDLCADFLQRLSGSPPLLIVLDGLDEAAGWELRLFLPLDPPPSFKVLVSARLTATHPTPEDWLSALEWDRFEGLAESMALGPISTEGVADILRRMDMQLDALADRGEIVDALYTLSEQGDPLLLNLLVSDLWKDRE